MNEVKKDISIGDILKAMSPAILYMFITLIVEAAVCLCLFMTGTYSEGKIVSDSDFQKLFLENSDEIINHYGYLITFFSALIAAVIFFVFFKRECEKNSEYSKAYLSNGMKMRDICKMILLGAVAGPGLSRLLSLVKIDRILDDYEKVSKNLLNGSLILQIISLAIIVPVTEELIYRGVIYLRLKKYIGRWHSVIVTSVLFGVFHFNLLQGIYAFLLSFLLLFAFEKYKSIVAAMILHGTANLIAVLSEYYNMLDFIDKNIVVYLLVMAAELAMAVWMIYRMYCES